MSAPTWLVDELAEAAGEALELLELLDPETVAGWSIDQAHTLALVRTRLTRDLDAYRRPDPVRGR